MITGSRVCDHQILVGSPALEKQSKVRLQPGRTATRSGRHPIYTIGHSTRTYAELVAVLRAWQVSTLVDIRRFRRSRTNPQFNEPVLVDQLPVDGIAYVVLSALGGRRTKSQVADPSRNAGWDNVAFKNYADYADTEPFVDDLDKLMALAARSTCAVMCAEALWWRCHRRIVADHVIAHGIPVFHIFSETNAPAATATSFARIDRKHGTVSYPVSKRGGRRAEVPERLRARQTPRPRPAR